MEQRSLFGLSEHLERISKNGDPLEILEATVDFEYFRGWLVEGLGYGDGARGGRPPFDPVSMFKALILQAQHNLSDAKMEFMIRDRLSWMRFLGFDLGGPTPDENTIRLFRNKLTETGALRRVMKADPAEFEHALFQSRVEAFVGMTDRGWQPEVRCGEDPFVSMRRTKRNGRFFGSIRVSDEKRRECIARRGNSDGHIEVRIQGVDQSLVQAPVYLVPRQGISVVSDIDDTIKHTDVRSRREMLLNTFVRPFSAIDGMAEAYQRLAELDFAFHYVSSSPWQLFTPLRMLLNDCSFPGGTIHLRNFALRDHMLRRVLPLHRRGKGAVIRHLIESFPERRFVLIGDSGERDPRIYAKLTQRYTSQIDSVLIRVLEPEHRGRLEEQWNRGDTLRGKLFTFLDSAEFASICAERWPATA